MPPRILTTSISVPWEQSSYAGFYCHENATAFTIQKANVAHALHGGTQGKLSTGWTFYGGKELAITAFAVSDPITNTIITCAGHGLANGDIVTIANTTSYDGIYIIQEKGENTFVIVKTYVADEGAKTGHAACYLTNANSKYTGVYFFAIPYQ